MVVVEEINRSECWKLTKRLNQVSAGNESDLPEMGGNLRSVSRILGQPPRYPIIGK